MLASIDSGAEMGVLCKNQLVPASTSKCFGSGVILLGLLKAPVLVVVISPATLDILYILLFGNVGDVGSFSRASSIELQGTL